MTYRKAPIGRSLGVPRTASTLAKHATVDLKAYSKTEREAFLLAWKTSLKLHEEAMEASRQRYMAAAGRLRRIKEIVKDA